MDNQYEKRKKFIVNTGYFVILISILYILFKYALGLVSPFVFALVFAYLLEKPAKFLSLKLRLPKKLVSIVLVFVFYSAIGFFLSFAGIKIVAVLIDVISNIPLLYEEQLAPFLQKRFRVMEIEIFLFDPALLEMINQGFDQFVKAIGENISNISIVVVGAISNFATRLPLFLVKVLLMVISTFFIASDYEALSGFVQRQFLGKSNDVLLRTKHFLVDTLLVIVRSYAIIMTITFIELAVGFSIINIPNAILIALMIALFDILPIFGTGGIMVPWTIISFIQGDFKLGIGLLVIYLFVTVVRNVIEPKIVGSQLGLHPVVTLMSMFVGVNLFGVLGLFGLPITLSLLKHLNDTGAVKLYK